MAEQAPLRINYGRLAVAAVGLVAFVTMLIAAVMALAGQATGRLAFTMLLLVVASFVGLRALALRARKRRAMERVQAAFADAMNPHFAEDLDSATRPHLTVAADYKGPSRPFDAQAPESDGDATTANVMEAPEAEAASSSAENKETADHNATLGEKKDWEPVAVPKPLYTEAAVVKREVAAPLEKPEEKKASADAPSIRQSEDLARVVHRAATDALIQGYAVSLDTGRIDIDQVLRRRRA